MVPGTTVLPSIKGAWHHGVAVLVRSVVVFEAGRYRLVDHNLSLAESRDPFKMKVTEAPSNPRPEFYVTGRIAVAPSKARGIVRTPARAELRGRRVPRVLHHGFENRGFLEGTLEV
jgi:hypothetical protein